MNDLPAASLIHRDEATPARSERRVRPNGAASALPETTSVIAVASSGTIRSNVAAHLAVIAVAAGVGAAATAGLRAVILLAVVLVVAILGVNGRGAIASLSLGSVALLERVNLGGVDLSYADLALIVTVVVSVALVPWKSLTLRRLLAITAAYLAILAVAILLNPSSRSIIEWGHRAVLVGGSLVVGAAVTRVGQERRALTVFIGMTTALAIVAIFEAVTSGFAPAYPFGINKNAAGFFILGAVVVMAVAAAQTAVPQRLIYPLQAVLILGMAACQSRASAATVMLIMCVIAYRRRAQSSLVLIAAAVALGAMIWTTSQRLFDEQDASYQFNSYATRVVTYEQSIEIWQREPLAGAGLRFWRDPEVTRGEIVGEPHNLAISALGESGYIGLFGLVVLNGGALIVLRRRRDPLGQVAFFITVAHIIDSLAGIFWVAGTGTLPWLLVGLAAADHGDDGPPALVGLPKMGRRSVVNR
jgi:hypothetical protein